MDKDRCSLLKSPYLYTLNHDILHHLSGLRSTPIFLKLTYTPDMHRCNSVSVKEDPYVYSLYTKVLKQHDNITWAQIYLNST